jgi:hypothetical protein
MAFLTLFSAPKPFSDPHINTIQRNAIQSWMHLGKDVEILLIGQETGLSDIAQEFGIAHLPNVDRNPWGTPLVSSIFAQAREASRTPLLAYVNADILLMPDFLDAIMAVSNQVERFLVIGRRWDLDIKENINFRSNWVQNLRDQVKSRGSRHQPAGSDYFIFPCDLFTSMPDFAIGRAGWDNWMIFHSLQRGVPVVDATASLMVVHQNHSYNHLPGGVPHYDLEETRINADLGGGMNNMYMILDASHELVAGRVRRARPSLIRFLRGLERWIQPEEERGVRWIILRRIRRWRRGLN